MVLNLKQIEQTCKVVYFCFLAHSLFDKCNFFSVFMGSKSSDLNNQNYIEYNLLEYNLI